MTYETDDLPRNSLRDTMFFVAIVKQGLNKRLRQLGQYSIRIIRSNRASVSFHYKTTKL